MTTAAEKIREAREARDELSAALRKAGINFPAMDVEPQGSRRPQAYALVDLGKVSAPVALQLAETITRGARR